MSNFVDRVRITCKAGNGGDGCVSFHREKFVLNGGPDGGDGGHGGDILIFCDPNMHTLLDFRFHSKYTAESGTNGGGGRCTGKRGESLTIKVPPGTVIRDADSGLVVMDMDEPGQTRTLLRGGRGGWGNMHFATPTRQAPNFAKPGTRTEIHTFQLELKTIADVGLVGYPNVGKSTLLSVITAAKPKIGNYHFTTLTPNLGLMRYHGQDIVICEVAARVFGYEHEMVEWCSGLSIEKILLDYVYEPDKVKEALSKHSPVFDKNYAGIYFIGRQGAVLADQTAFKDMVASDRLKGHIEQYIPYYEEGETIDNYGPHSYFTSLFIKADSREELDNITEYIFENASAKADDGTELLIPFVLERD